MTDGRNIDEALSVIDGVDHAPVADSYAPQVVRAFQLLASGRARCRRESFDAA